LTNHYKEYLYHDGDNPSGIDGQLLADKIIYELGRIEGLNDICDLGCGNGYLTHRLVKAGFNTIGVDASLSGIAAARQKYGNSSQFICADIGSKEPIQQLHRSSYDAVISSEVIEHLYRPADLIETAKWLLKPEGWLLLTTPYHGYMKYLALTILGKMDNHLNPLWDGGHIKFFSVRTLSKLLEIHGMHAKGFTFYGRLPFLWKSMICIAKTHHAAAHHDIGT
jgi:2-polyprenyl-3-methyl-5-hydroxy-6-metoxy-1,4-benzoquinol methylase